MQQTPKKADASHSGPAGGFGPFMQGRPRAPGEFGDATAPSHSQAAEPEPEPRLSGSGGPAPQAGGSGQARPARRGAARRWWWTGGGRALRDGTKRRGRPRARRGIADMGAGWAGAWDGMAFDLCRGRADRDGPHRPASFQSLARFASRGSVSPTRSGSARFAPDVPPGRTSGGSFDREGPGGRWVVRTRREWMVGRKCVMCSAWPPALRSPRCTHGMRECDARPRLHLNLVRPARFAAQFQFVHHGRAAPALITD